jgi:hypothetical protein
MGGQSTFIEKPVVEKHTTKSVVVPALERARQAKLAEVFLYTYIYLYEYIYICMIIYEIIYICDYECM